LRSSGPLADSNPLLFSTKYCDRETGLLYYGYRYLTTVTGRWLSRDPLSNADNANELAFVANNPINRFDPNGLWAVKSHALVLRGAADRWGADSKGFFTWHDCPINMLQNLQLGNDRVDGTDVGGFMGLGDGFIEANKAENSYQHAMRALEQTAADAEKKMNAFIEDLVVKAKEKAKAANVYYQKGNKWLALDGIKTAIYYIGKAQHPVADSTSPAHEGFQIWYGENPLFSGIAARHGLQETPAIFLTRDYLERTVKAVDDRFGKVFKEIIDDGSKK
jgi:RHS repeat-associated protein